MTSEAVEAATTAEGGELPTSQLGSKEYWDHVYDRELGNFEEFGEEGEVWFGETCLGRVLSRVASLNTQPLETVSVLDLGTGNGWTLIELVREHDFAGVLVGTDYSATAVRFARRLAASTLEETNVCVFTEDDFINSRLATRAQAASDDPSEDEEESRVSSLLQQIGGKFDFVLDKGTYDAISLREDSAAARDTYRTTTAGLVKASGGFFVITSCNWTKEELTAQFSTLFNYHSHIDYPTIKFAGATGSTYATVVFTLI